MEKLTEQGLMTEAGQAVIDFAKQKGNWLKLEEIDNLLIPPDLQKEFDKNQTAYDNFKAFRDSSKKIILGWISLTKNPVTRQKRIEETVELAEKNIKANHYVQ
ncbi:MAG: YdeI/OmpD-associated family protein [Bacteroidota bacterium]